MPFVSARKTRKDLKDSARRRTVRGAFVQTRPKFGQNEENIDDAIKLASKIRSDIYVFPELCNSGYAFTSRKESEQLSEPLSGGASVDKLQSFSERQKCTLVAGLAENDRRASKIYNSSIIIERGSILGCYRKMHLFYREKLWFDQSNSGFKVHSLQSLGCNIGVLICFDWFFPEASRELMLRGADIICHPSNLVMPGKAQAGMLVRAFENKVFVITANRVGRENRGVKDNFLFTGKSQIATPIMTKLTSASATDTTAKAAALELGLARNKNVTSMNNIFQDRRTKFYAEGSGHKALEAEQRAGLESVAR